MSNDAWIDWPTHAGRWWSWASTVPDRPVRSLVWAQETRGVLCLLEYGTAQDRVRETCGTNWRFLDAHLTTPAPPKGGA